MLRWSAAKSSAIPSTPSPASTPPPWAAWPTARPSWPRPAPRQTSTSTAAKPTPPATTPKKPPNCSAPSSTAGRTWAAGHRFEWGWLTFVEAPTSGRSIKRTGLNQARWARKSRRGRRSYRSRECDQVRIQRTDYRSRGCHQARIHPTDCRSPDPGAIGLRSSPQPTLLLQPNRIPMRIIPHRLHAPGPDRTGYHIPGHSPQIVLLPYRPVMKPLLPDPPADLPGAEAFHPPYHLFKTLVVQPQQPVKMIRHHHIAPRVCLISTGFLAQRVY